MVTNFTRHIDVAAVFEWVVAFIFTLYILSFVVDLYPAVATKDPASRFEKPRLPDDETAAAAASGTRRDYALDRNAVNC